MKLTRALVALVVLPVLALAACAASPDESGAAITSVTFSQYQAIEGFDDSERVQDDASELKRLQDLLDEYDVTPGVTDLSPEEACAGSLTTTAVITYSDEKTADLVVDGCGESKYSKFNQAASDLFTEWR